MVPSLYANQIVIVSGRLRVIEGDVVVIWHQNMEKIKRISAIDPLKGVFVVGDNRLASTDSRHFGWIAPEQIRGIVIWPRNRGSTQA